VKEYRSVEREHVDPIYGYCDEYIDAKFNSFRSELKQQQEVLLKTQKELARFIILSTVQSTKVAIYRSITLPYDIDADIVVTQLLNDANSATGEIENSSNPLPIAIKFQKQCNRLMTELGIDVLTVT
jgi:hypothetical protein